MIQNLLILKKGIPGLVYVNLKTETEESEVPTINVIIQEINE